jgi:diaminopimelate decarboxylase
VYAAKALALPAILSLFAAYGLGIDVVSGGELLAALRAGVSPSSITFHGNNKGEDELREAIDAGVGLVAVDNLYELDLLERILSSRDRPQSILLRVNPGIDVHTHEKIATGVVDSKFGFPIWNGSANEGVERALAIPGLDLAGYHAHLGSQLFDLNAPVVAVDKIMSFAADIRDRFGVQPRVISPGGGMGIAYRPGMQEVDLRSWVDVTVSAVKAACERHRLPVPAVVFEPGRVLVGRAGVALYRVGSRKEIPGTRTYVSVDGGMADNIRPALYDAVYTAELANRAGDEASLETVTIAGKYCESGDLLIENVALPRLQPGDLLAMPAAGAYSIPLASNYNMSPRPAVVMVRDGEATVIRRRETYDDLLSTST